MPGPKYQSSSPLSPKPEALYPGYYFPLAHWFFCLSKSTFRKGAKGNCHKCDTDCELIVNLSTPTYICVLIGTMFLNKGIRIFILEF